MPEERHDVHADPTQDHLSQYADESVVEDAEKADLAIQKEHLGPVSYADDEPVVESVEAPASLFPEDNN